MKNIYTFHASFLMIIFSFFFSSTLMAQGNEKQIAKKVERLLKKMTLEEKIGQMNQYNGFWDATGVLPELGEDEKFDHFRKGWVGAVLNVRGVKNVKKIQSIVVKESRLGIPLLFGFDLIHGYKTIFPVPLAEAASWDMELIKRSARVGAKEATGAGINWTFAPMVDISRDARWGRVMEGAGEDPYLGAEIAKARVRGFQGTDLSDKHTLAACAKHFAAYGFPQAGKDYNEVEMGRNTLFNIVLPPFLAAKNAGVSTFMNAFNTLDGIPATGDYYLQRTLLKKLWNFSGFIVSDWGSINELVNHGFAKDLKQASRIAINAGSDMDMESYGYVRHLKDLVSEKKVPIENINDAVRRILTLKFKLGLFDNPYLYTDGHNEKASFLTPEHRKVALDMAKKSIVLLKNEGLLPIQKEGKKIALIGALADDKDSPLGNWRLAADSHSAISVLEGMQKYSANNLMFAKGPALIKKEGHFVFELPINNSDKSGMQEAIQTAKQADIVVMVLGEHGYQSGEGRSRAHLGFPGFQQELLEAVYKVNPNIVLVLMSGRPLCLPWSVENIPSILQAWHLGTESGNAIASVLYGDENPSGKLPMTFPRNVGQIPIHYNYLKTGRGKKLDNNLVFWSHYIDETNKPLFAFGHGLSYTNFLYDNLKVNKIEGSSIQVSVELKNNGKLEGQEVVQLYIQDVNASISRPIQELKGFKKISLAPGENKTIQFKLNQSDLSFYNAAGKKIFQPGKFIIMVGGSSDKVLSKAIDL